MAEIKTCKLCGKLFEGNQLLETCPPCHEKDEKDFDRIRQYLDIHPAAKVFEVSTSLNIPVFQIKRYLREGRLEILEKNQRFLLCERCGKPISSGYYCDECPKELPHNYKSYYAGAGLKGKSRAKDLEEAAKKPRIRYLSKDR